MNEDAPGSSAKGWEEAMAGGGGVHGPLGTAASHINNGAMARDAFVDEVMREAWPATDSHGSHTVAALVRRLLAWLWTTHMDSAAKTASSGQAGDEEEEEAAAAPPAGVPLLRITPPPHVEVMRMEDLRSQGALGDTIAWARSERLRSVASLACGTNIHASRGVGGGGAGGGGGVAVNEAEQERQWVRRVQLPSPHREDEDCGAFRSHLSRMSMMASCGRDPVQPREWPSLPASWRDWFSRCPLCRVHVDVLGLMCWPRPPHPTNCSHGEAPIRFATCWRSSQRERVWAVPMNAMFAAPLAVDTMLPCASALVLCYAPSRGHAHQEDAVVMPSHSFVVYEVPQRMPH